MHSFINIANNDVCRRNTSARVGAPRAPFIEASIEAMSAKFSSDEFPAFCVVSCVVRSFVRSFVEYIRHRDSSERDIDEKAAGLYGRVSAARARVGIK